jgi:tetratricopeptide (TPR) repeat protein
MLYNDLPSHRGSGTMSGQERPSRRRLVIGPVLVFPLVGPAAAALTVAAPLALLGLFTLGPGGLAYYALLAAWWLPGMYKLLAPPFLLTGIFVALAGIFAARLSIVVALIAAELAFSTYFALWLLIPGGVEIVAPDYANLWAGFRGTPWSVLLVLVATAVCWRLARAMDAGGSQALPDISSSRRAARWEAPGGVAAVVVGAAALATVLFLSARSPATAWKDCTEGNYEDALRGCTVIVGRAADESPERRATAYLRRGSAREGYSQDLTGAIADYSEAIRLAPDRAEAYGRRGLAYARRGETDGVIADLDTALRLDPNVLSPDTFQVFRSRGLASFQKGEYDRAIVDHTQEIRLTPFYADGYLHRAAAYLAKGDAGQAITEFSEAIRVEPYRPAGYIERGSIYLSMGDTDRALTDFDDAIRRLPSHPLTAAAYRMRGLVLERRGDLTEALAAFETALSLTPSDADAREGGERVRAALSRQRGG